MPCFRTLRIAWLLYGNRSIALTRARLHWKNAAGSLHISVPEIADDYVW
ncbi:hypothetical protein [Spirosoma panaciterrae]|nr:hypothetical protein [Spirosoma panaciterrae]